MGWNEKQLEKHKIHKLLQQALNSPEYKEERRKWEEQAVLQALVRFTFISLLWLEMNFKCKRNGFIKFLDFVKNTMADIEEDVEFFNDSNEYYKEKYDLDVMEYIGLAIEKKGVK